MIQTIEEIAYWAVPPAISLQMDGWRLRFNHGVTRRANSVWPNADFGRHSLAEKMAVTEQFYRDHSAIRRFQITDAALPTGLDDYLAANGYAKSPATNVQIAPIAQVIQRASTGRTLVTVITPACTPDWLDAYCAIERVTAHRRPHFTQMWERVPGAIAFCQVIFDGQTAAVGLSVAKDGWAGLFNIATRPEFRRRGAAWALLGALGAWAASSGASTFYLQVHAQNEPALALYDRLGFKTLYQYHYRELGIGE